MLAPPTELTDLESRFLHHADGLLAVDKPAGIPTSGLQLDDPRCLQFWLMRHFGDMVWAIHQLDADTSGVNLFATDKKVAAHTQRRMAAQTAAKTYLAICHGAVDLDEQEIDRPIGFLDAERKLLGVTEAGRPARSRVTVLDRSDAHSLLRVRIFTGRTHQIRIHLASLGHPLVGECWYRDPPCKLTERQALHAWSIRFEDGEEPGGLQAPVPADLGLLARAMQLALPD